MCKRWIENDKLENMLVYFPLATKHMNDCTVSCFPLKTVKLSGYPHHARASYHLNCPHSPVAVQRENARGRDFHPSPDSVCHLTATLRWPFSKPFVSGNSGELFLLAGCSLLLTCCSFLFAFIFVKLRQHFAQMTLLEFLPLENSLV